MKKQMKLNQSVVMAALMSAATGYGLAEDQNDEINQLKQQIQELDQKVRILERKKELDDEAAAAKGNSTPLISAGSGGVIVSSPDTNFVLKLRGYVQADGRFFIDDNIKGNSSFLLRRVRPVFEGAVFQHYEYKIMPDFGSGTSSSGNNLANNGMLQDAFLNVHYWDEAQLMIGKFKSPIGLERLQSARNLLFVERSFPTQLAPNRDVGIQLWGNVFNGAIEYAIAGVNGAGDSGSDDIESADDGKDIAGRIFVRPFKPTKINALAGLGFGVGGSVGDHEGPLRNYVTAGQQTFFRWQTGSGSATAPNVTAHGQQYRIMPQLSYYWGPFGLFAEYAISSLEAERVAGASKTDRQFENSAWQVSASYVLTGEDASYDGVAPRHPFALQGGGWGAWEIAARGGRLSLDRKIFPQWSTAGSAREATEWGVGLNWYLNRGVKLNLDFHHTQFEDASRVRGAVTAKDEQVILTRVQVAF
jgi:phosphate-selective porin OprO/OprP